MGPLQDDVKDAKKQSHMLGSEAVRKRGPHARGAEITDPGVGSYKQKGVQLTDDEVLEATIRALPSWKDQLSMRGYFVGEKPRTATACAIAAESSLLIAYCT